MGAVPIFFSGQAAKRKKASILFDLGNEVVKSQ